MLFLTLEKECRDNQSGIIKRRTCRIRHLLKRKEEKGTRVKSCIKLNHGQQKITFFFFFFPNNIKLNVFGCLLLATCSLKITTISHNQKSHRQITRTFFFFFGDFQSIVFALDDNSISSDQNTNQFFV